MIPFQSANAAQITVRSLTLQADTVGGSAPSTGPGDTTSKVKHLFKFTLPSAGDANLGSIRIQYCLTAADTGTNTCVSPTDLDTLTATLTDQTGAMGFVNMAHPAANEFIISRAAPAPVPAGTIVTYQISGIRPPSTPNQTFFARITTYASIDGTGGSTDAGVVAASTTQPIDLSGIMPESLVFCTGATVGLDVATSTVPDCSTATPGTVAFNELFSPTSTATASSQMAASTNAGAGYAITVNGTTLTSGTNTIVPITTGPGTNNSNMGIRGTSQFGMNLRANTVLTAASFPGTSADVAPAANAVNYRGEPAAGYGDVDFFKFVSGDIVADSYNGGAGGTDAQIFTVSYIVNVPGSQPAGTYSTTLTYICTPTF